MRPDNATLILPDGRTRRVFATRVGHDTARVERDWTNDSVLVPLKDVTFDPPEVPFSSEDEKRGIEPIEIARKLVSDVVKESYSEPVEFETYVVWFNFTLKSWKALISTTLPDGRYYEVTYADHRGQTYVDTYLKVNNTVFENV